MSQYLNASSFHIFIFSFLFCFASYAPSRFPREWWGDVMRRNRAHERWLKEAREEEGTRASLLAPPLLPNAERSRRTYRCRGECRKKDRAQGGAVSLLAILHPRVPRAGITDPAMVRCSPDRSIRLGLWRLSGYPSLDLPSSLYSSFCSVEACSR